MIVEVEKSGAQTSNGCVSQFQISQGDLNQVRIRLVDVTVPDPPLVYGFTDAFTTDIDSFSTPVIRSMLELVDFIDGLVDSVSEARLMEAYWDGTTFEILPLVKTINVSTDFRATFKLPAAMLVNTIYANTINVAAIDQSDGYVVQLQVGEAEGFYKQEHTNIVAVFPRGANKPNAEYWLQTREPVMTGLISIYSRRRVDGLLRELEVRDAERWSARIEVEATGAIRNPARRF